MREQVFRGDVFERIVYFEILRNKTKQNENMTPIVTLLIESLWRKTSKICLQWLLNSLLTIPSD